MPKISQAIFLATAIAIPLGAAELASGHDIAGSLQAQTSAPMSINRTAKADRATTGAIAAAPTQTISVRLQALSDTSIVIRVPAAYLSRNEVRSAPHATSPLPSPSLLDKSTKRKLTVACEPVVSTLTEVAKLLQPGRCVT